MRKTGIEWFYGCICNPALAANAAPTIFALMALMLFGIRPPRHAQKDANAHD